MQCHIIVAVQVERLAYAQVAIDAEFFLVTIVTISFVILGHPRMAGAKRQTVVVTAQYAAGHQLPLGKLGLHAAVLDS